MKEAVENCGIITEVLILCHHSNRRGRKVDGAKTSIQK
jgi:hypothetical protein